MAPANGNPSFTVFWAASYALGLIVIVLYGLNEFANRTSDEKMEGFLSKIPLPELTRPKNYATAYLVYLFGLIVFFTILSIIGRTLLPAVNDKWKNLPPEIFPALSALLLTGLLPNVPGLRLPENWWRAFMHKHSGIPQAVEDIRDEIRSRRFKLEEVSSKDAECIFPSDELTLSKALEAKELNVNSIAWLTIAAIFCKIPAWRNDPQIRRIVGGKIFDDRDEEFDLLELRYKELKHKMYSGRAQNFIEKFNESTEHNLADIDALNHDLFTLLACVVISRPSEISLQDALSAMNFETIPESATRKKNQDESDALLTGLGVGLLASFCFLATVLTVSALRAGAGPEGQLDIGGKYEKELAGWLLGDLSRYLPIAVLALALRHAAIPDQKSKPDSFSELSPRVYARILLTCLLGSVFVCLLARALNTYCIWQWCFTQSACPDPKHVMGTSDFFWSFLQQFWLTPFIVTLFSFSGIVVLNQIRKGNNYYALVIIAMTIMILTIFNLFVSIDVYKSTEISDMIIFIASSTIFYIVVLGAMFIRLADSTVVMSLIRAYPHRNSIATS